MKKKYVSSIGIIGALVVNAFSDNHGDLSKQIEGEWIMFRGDNYEIKNNFYKLTQKNDFIVNMGAGDCHNLWSILSKKNNLENEKNNEKY